MYLVCIYNRTVHSIYGGIYLFEKISSLCRSWTSQLKFQSSDFCLILSDEFNCSWPAAMLFDTETPPTNYWTWSHVSSFVKLSLRFKWHIIFIIISTVWPESINVMSCHTLSKMTLFGFLFSFDQATLYIDQGGYRNPL